LSTTVFDCVVIGGGINGCGIARDAAGRGLSVLLAEKGDLGGGTSSAATKLIHGGLRYLEYYEFRLVRESLQEREVLLAMAPHIVSPLRFVLPHHRDLRPAWLIRLGLFLYDHLGKRKRLPPSSFIHLDQDEAGRPLKPGFTRAFEYSDCRVDDARLVVLNALDAAERGAEIHVRTFVRSATRQGELWRIVLENTLTGERRNISARSLINASGPWISEVITNQMGLQSRYHTRLVKGSHIVVPRLFDHSRAYIFQNADNRIVFAIPYEDAFTLIGTTDVEFQGSPDTVAITPDEVAYLCAVANEYFSRPIRPEDVAWAFSGVRPLHDEEGTSAQAATRDYVLELKNGANEPPLLNVFGGKITTYRCLAEEALKKLQRILQEATGKKMGPPWTRRSLLPGGDIGTAGLEGLAARLVAQTPALPAATAQRWVRHYGTRALNIAGSGGALGRHFGAGLYQCEVEYLVQVEWARTVEDILWRRTKQGLRMTKAEAQRLDEWLHAHLSALTPSAAARTTHSGE